METHCTECGFRLFSPSAQQAGTHQECIEVDYEEPLELEDRLDKLLG